MSFRYLAAAMSAGLLAANILHGGEPCRSGLDPGQRPGPYSAVISTGPERGKSYCFICDTADKPAVVVFARDLSEPLGKLLRQLDKLAGEQPTAGLRSWATFLRDDQLQFDPRLVQWSKKLALRNVPLGVFEDVEGPPSYRLSRDANVTVILFVKRKVEANFAFRPGELTDERVAEILKAVPMITAKK